MKIAILRKKISNSIKDKGWSVVTTSEKAGIPLPTLKSILYGQSNSPRIETLEKLAKVLDFNINDVVEGSSSAQNERMDSELFRECLDAVEAFLKERNIILEKDKLIRVIDSLSSLLLKKKRKNLSYSIDDETIEWIIDNIN